jgi:dihydrofolate reductase
VSSTVLSMSMSLDGFIAGPDDDADEPLGAGGRRLHDWLWAAGPGGESGIPGRPSGLNGEVFDEFMATGAVVAGRRTFDLAGGWAGDHHGVPIFVLTRGGPGAEAEQWPLVTYVNDVETAMARAKEVAGGRNVLVHGARTAQLGLAAGVLDELEIHLIPVLLGRGRRLFDNLGDRHVELELTRVVDASAVTHLRYRIKR